jgi:hypothetical protein
LQSELDETSLYEIDITMLIVKKPTDKVYNRKKCRLLIIFIVMMRKLTI